MRFATSFFLGSLVLAGLLLSWISRPKFNMGSSLFRQIYFVDREHSIAWSAERGAVSLGARPDWSEFMGYFEDVKRKSQILNSRLEGVFHWDSSYDLVIVKGRSDFHFSNGVTLFVSPDYLKKERPFFEFLLGEELSRHFLENKRSTQESFLPQNISEYMPFDDSSIEVLFITELLLRQALGYARSQLECEYGALRDEVPCVLTKSLLQAFDGTSWRAQSRLLAVLVKHWQGIGLNTEERVLFDGFFARVQIAWAKNIVEKSGQKILNLSQALLRSKQEFLSMRDYFSKWGIQDLALFSCEEEWSVGELIKGLPHVERVWVLDDCKHQLYDNFKSNRGGGIHSFVETKAKPSYVSYHLPSLKWAIERNSKLHYAFERQGALDVIRDFQQRQDLGKTLGWSKNIVSSTRIVKPLAVIDGVLSFREAERH